MSELFPLLVALAVFFGCVGVWPRRVERLVQGWSALRLRQNFRTGVRRARLRAVR